MKNDEIAKTGSGQTFRKLTKEVGSAPMPGRPEDATSTSFGRWIMLAITLQSGLATGLLLQKAVVVSTFLMCVQSLFR